MKTSSTVGHFDLDGTPITFAEWASKIETKDYGRIARTELGERFVSTVWLGIDHSHGDGPPIIFETMVFPDLAHQRRYSTRAEAEAGHAEIVALVEREAEA